jgi:hypothetical protein
VAKEMELAMGIEVLYYILLLHYVQKFQKGKDVFI